MASLQLLDGARRSHDSFFPEEHRLVVVISHDRWFLDRIATHMLAFEGDTQVVWFEGNCQEYEADRKRSLKGRFALRACLTNFRTTQAHIETTVREVLDEGRRQAESLPGT